MFMCHYLIIIDINFVRIIDLMYVDIRLSTTLDVDNE